MKEYSDKEFENNYDDTEKELKERKDNEVYKIENGFEPLEEEQVIDYEITRYFEPNDEKKMAMDQFKVNFNPKDEDDTPKTLKIKKFNIKTASFYEDTRGKIKIYLDKLLENYPNKIKSDDIITKTQLAKKLKVSKPFVIDSIRDYLTKKYGKDKMRQINEFLWP
jgi:hypothetical protein